MSLDLARQALDTKLNAMLPALATAWENTSLTPDTGTPFQATNLLPAEPGNPVYGPGYVEQGIYQVTLNYPIKNGPADAQARAEAIRTAFARGTSLPKGGIVVLVTATPEIMQGAIFDSIYQLPVRVRWQATVGL